MASEIKLRRSWRGGSSSASQPEQSLADSVLDDSSGTRPSPSKHDKHQFVSSGIFNKIIIPLLLAFLLLLVLVPSKLIRPTKNLKVPDVSRTNDARTKELSSLAAAASHHPLPFSTLISKSKAGGPAYVTPLTGVYTLGEDHLLQEHVSTASESKSPTTGSIQFPHVDLSSIIKEESTTPKYGSAFQQDIFRKESPIDDVSFLAIDSPFKSAIARYNSVPDDRALLTRCGYKMGDPPNQDRSFIANFSFGEKKVSKALLMGIFDGHGPRGHIVSHYIALQFPGVFASILRRKQKEQSLPLHGSLRNPKQKENITNCIKKALVETFLAVDEGEPVKSTGGSTASLAFYPGLGSIVYVANAGDSTTLIARYSKSKRSSTIVFQNRKHKPHLQDERERIERAGGQVMIPPSLLVEDGSTGGLKETSRLIIPDPKGGPFGGLALAMSRSIGDFDGKRVGLTAEPEVDAWDVNHHFSEEQILDSEWFVVTASDGVYDLLPPEIVVEYLGRSLYHDDQLSPLEACERVILESSRLWAKATIGMPYRDDITIGVSKINFVL